MCVCVCVCWRKGLAILLWNSLKVADKQAVRTVAIASTVFWSLHCGGKRIFAQLELLRASFFILHAVLTRVVFEYSISIAIYQN